jgi:hypothetical protein
MLFYAACTVCNAVAALLAYHSLMIEPYFVYNQMKNN